MAKQVILSISIKEELQGGFSVICTDLDVASQGETMDEAISNIKEAVELYLESAKELNMIDEVLEQLGLSKENLKQDISIPKIFKTEIPVNLAA